MATVEIPRFWLLVNPENQAIGSLIGAWSNGDIHIARADDALREFYDTKRESEAAAKKGFRVYGVELEGFDKYFVARKPVPSE
jgi:hypothetical protein